MDITLPALNVGLLSQIVTWAVLDDQDLTQYNPAFAGWGHWNQSFWGQLEQTGQSLTAVWFEEVVGFTEPNICGTAACMAGQAVSQMGMSFIFNDTNYDQASVCAPRIQLGLRDGRPVWGPDPSAPQRNISTYAREVLGLTESEGAALFDGDNNIERIVGLANLFAEVRGVTLAVEPGVLAMGVLDQPVGMDLDYEKWSDVRNCYDVDDLSELRVTIEPNPHIAEWEARQAGTATTALPF